MVGKVMLFRPYKYGCVLFGLSFGFIPTDPSFCLMWRWSMALGLFGIWRLNDGWMVAAVPRFVGKEGDRMFRYEWTFPKGAYQWSAR